MSEHHAGGLESPDDADESLDRCPVCGTRIIAEVSPGPFQTYADPCGHRIDGATPAINHGEPVADGGHETTPARRKWNCIQFQFRSAGLAHSFFNRVSGTGVWPSKCRASWSLLALGAFGDVVTTRAGMALGAAEANPIAESVVIEATLPDLVGMKAVAIAMVMLAWSWAGLLDLPAPDAIPASVGAVWVTVTLWNLVVVAGVL